MNTFTGRLDQLEAQLQAFIEGKLARLSPLRGDQVNLARRLVSSMRAGAISSGDGILYNGYLTHDATVLSAEEGVFEGVNQISR